VSFPPITAICNTEGCGTAWPTSVAGKFTSGIKFTGCTVSPCPKCGGVGRIPDGTYTEFAIALNDPRDVAVVKAALEALYRRAKRGADAAQIGKDISRNYPFLAPLKPFLPKDAAGLGAYLLAGIAFASLLRECKSRPEPVSNVYVQVELQQAITRAGAAPSPPKGPPQRSPRHRRAR